MDADTAALLEVTRRHTRAVSRQLRDLARLHARLADRLDDEAAAHTYAQPQEAQRNDDHQDEDR